MGGLGTWLHCARHLLTFPPETGLSNRPNLCGARAPLRSQTPPGLGMVAASREGERRGGETERGRGGGERAVPGRRLAEARAAATRACAARISARRLGGVGAWVLIGRGGGPAYEWRAVT